MDSHVFWFYRARAPPQTRSADFAPDRACAEGERKLPASFPPEGKIGNEADTRGRLSRDRAKEYGPHKTIYNRFARWSERGIWPNNASASSRASKTFWPISSPARRASRAFDAVCSGGHDTDAFRVVLKKPKKRSVIRAKSNRKTRIRHGGKTSPNRTVIERCFGRLQDSAASPRAMPSSRQTSSPPTVSWLSSPTG